MQDFHISLFPFHARNLDMSIVLLIPPEDRQPGSKVKGRNSLVKFLFFLKTTSSSIPSQSLIWRQNKISHGRARDGYFPDNPWDVASPSWSYTASQATATNCVALKYQDLPEIFLIESKRNLYLPSWKLPICWGSWPAVSSTQQLHSKSWD